MDIFNHSRRLAINCHFQLHTRIYLSHAIYNNTLASDGLRSKADFDRSQGLFDISIPVTVRIFGGRNTIHEWSP